MTARAHNDQVQQNLAEAAVASGAAVPLSQVLGLVEKATAGQVLNVALDLKATGEWIYHLTLLTPDGQYCDVTVDAKRNKLLQTTWR